MPALFQVSELLVFGSRECLCRRSSKRLDESVRRRVRGKPRKPVEMFCALFLEIGGRSTEQVDVGSPVMAGNPGRGRGPENLALFVISAQSLRPALFMGWLVHVPFLIRGKD